MFERVPSTSAAGGQPKRDRRQGANPSASLPATLSERELDAANAAALPAGAASHEVLQCQYHLINVGYVWKAPGAGGVWQPGIPSLMDYVEAHTP